MSAIHNIWPRESGILDIEGDWKDLCASEVMSIRDVWRKLRDDLTEKKTYQGVLGKALPRVGN